MHEHPIQTPEEALKFILGGNARFTLRSVATGVRYTYRVRSSKDGRVYFVRLLTNDGHYTYLGMLKNGRFTLTEKSKTKDSPPIRAFTWTYDHLLRDQLLPSLEIWHDGHCGRCGRSLTVPASIASGFGPECITKL